MVDSGTDYGKGVVHVCKREKGLALQVGFRDVEGVEGRRVVVEDSEEVVIVANKVAIGRVGMCLSILLGDVRCGCHSCVVASERAKETWTA